MNGDAHRVRVTEQADIIVARPLPRETLRGVDYGYLVTCTGMHCTWQGLFPDQDLAATAVERHYDHERRTGQYHHGTKTYTVVELVDHRTAYTLQESSLGLSVEDNRLRTPDGSVREHEVPRTTESVPDIVARGDEITRRDYADSVVYRVTETRSLGLPTWSVVYVDADVDLLAASKRDYYWINECIAQEGTVYQSFGPDPLSTPAFEVVGQAEHQADFSEFGEGTS